MQKLGGFPVNSKLTVSTINVFFAGLPLLQYVYYSGTRIRTRVPVLEFGTYTSSTGTYSTCTRRIVHVYYSSTRVP